MSATNLSKIVPGGMELVFAFCAFFVDALDSRLPSGTFPVSCTLEPLRYSVEVGKSENLAWDSMEGALVSGFVLGLTSTALIAGVSGGGLVGISGIAVTSSFPGRKIGGRDGGDRSGLSGR